MAVLGCFNCGYCMQHTGTPNGIEYEATTYVTWDEFLSLNAEMTLCFTEGPEEDYITIWRCPKCGAMHLGLGYDTRIARVYLPTEIDDKVNFDDGVKFYLFHDLEHDKLFGDDMTTQEFENSEHTCQYMLLNDQYMRVFRDRAMTRLQQSFKAFEREYVEE